MSSSEIFVVYDMQECIIWTCYIIFLLVKLGSFLSHPAKWICKLNVFISAKTTSPFTFKKSKSGSVFCYLQSKESYF